MSAPLLPCDRCGRPDCARERGNGAANWCEACRDLVLAVMPELVEALEAAVQVIEQLVPEPSARGVADVVLFQARAAIARAREEVQP